MGTITTKVWTAADIGLAVLTVQNSPVARRCSGSTTFNSATPTLSYSRFRSATMSYGEFPVGGSQLSARLELGKSTA